jgi:integrase
MASLSHDANGTRRILFVDGHGTRRAIRLGHVPAKTAETVLRRVEELAAHAIAGTAPDADLAGWLAAVPPQLYRRLVRVGLAAPRAEDKAEAVVTLEQLTAAFKERAAVKRGTAVNYAQTIDSLLVFYGPETPVGEITAESADDWRKAIATATKTEGHNKKKRAAADGRLAPATVSKRVRTAKQVFQKAVAWGWIERNPFAAVRAGSQSNPSRSFYVSEDTIEAVLDACPGAEWRTLVGLCRFAGLRCPSEVGGLTWGDVDFGSGRLTVRSPKTEHHGHDHAIRFVPISPRLRRILADGFDAAAPGATRVVPMAARQGANLRTQLERIIVKAGHEPWPRLLQNLRASCETDWATRHPAHAVAKWLGHSPRIAQAHYLVTTDAHFRAVIEEEDGGSTKSGAESGAVAAQKAAQHDAATSRKERREQARSEVIPAKDAVSVVTVEKVENAGIGPV